MLVLGLGLALRTVINNGLGLGLGLGLVGYHFGNFGLPRPLCSRLRPDVRDRRQTDRRQTSDKSIA